MNNRQKEVFQHQLKSEKAVLAELEKQYKKALNDIDLKIRILESDELTQSRIYRLEHQKALKAQVQAILDKLHADEYSTIEQFLSASYTDGFLGTMYDMHGQGVPLIFPIDPQQAVDAVLTESKLSVPLYDALGVDTKKLSKTIASEISRGIASDMAYTEIARNIANASKAPLSRAKTIVQTESHRIQEKASLDAQRKAKSKGADILKQWNSTLDGDTRPAHRKLDGQVREIEEPFEASGLKAMYPGDFGDPAEDCNCRCRTTQRARWALGEEELQTLKNRAEFFGVDKTNDFEDFKKKYLQAAKEESKSLYDDTVVNPVVKTAKYRNLYNNLDESGEVQRVACERARNMLKHRSGTKYEDLTFVDSKTGEYLTRNDYNVENEVLPSRAMRNMVSNSDPYSIIAIHNHPGSSVPSLTDINTAYQKKYKYGLIACHNGTLIKYEITGEYNDVIVGALLDRTQKKLYNSSAEELSKILEQLRSENIVLEVFK